jgi:hypothetical protein
MQLTNCTCIALLLEIKHAFNVVTVVTDLSFHTHTHTRRFTDAVILRRRHRQLFIIL